MYAGELEQRPRLFSIMGVSFDGVRLFVCLLDGRMGCLAFTPEVDFTKSSQLHVFICEIGL